MERAEERLAAGTYGLSTLSGEPIPDARLEAFPTAELTVEESERNAPEHRSSQPFLKETRLSRSTGPLTAISRTVPIPRT